MDVTELSSEKVTIAFAPSELAFLCNAINESLEALDDWEFETRTGESRKSAATLLSHLRRLHAAASQLE